jgi:hypothetical protein
MRVRRAVPLRRIGKCCCPKGVHERKLRTLTEWKIARRAQKIGRGELAGTGAKGRARGESARPHAKAWAERWRNVAEHVAAAGAAPVIADRASGVGAQPVTAGVAGRIDALNGEAGQVLHSIFPQEASLLASRRRRFAKLPCQPQKDKGWRIVRAGDMWCQEKTLQDMGVVLRQGNA